MTLLPEPWARKGARFLFEGPTPQCAGCPLVQPCLALKSGLYQVRAVRKVTHTCPGPFDGVVVVAEVEPALWQVSLPPGPGTLEGATLTLRGDAPQRECELAECPNFDLCHPPGLEPGRRVTIDSLASGVECPLGYRLVQAKVGPADS